ncbi:MAG: tetratricopeptide repeat protein [bacterium]
MSKITRKEMRHDAFTEIIFRFLSKIEKYKQQILIAGGIIIAFLIIIFVVNLSINKTTNQSVKLLQKAHQYFHQTLKENNEGIIFNTNEEKYNKALKSYQKIISKYSFTQDAKEAFLYTGHCYYELKNFKKATEIYQKCLFKFRGTIEIAYIKLNLASCCKSLNNNEKSIFYYKQVEKEYKNTILAEYAIISMADIYAKSNKEKEAINTYQKLIDFYPESSFKKEIQDKIEWLKNK